jgi:uncharacterized protein (TIGR02246 family)
MAETNLTVGELVARFNDAFNAHDVEAMMGMMTEDCVFENTHPPPDGARYEGRQQVAFFWDEFFAAAREQAIEIEEIAAFEDRCVMRWIYRWRDSHGTPRHVRGTDIYRARGGLIAEKLSYVKG